MEELAPSTAEPKKKEIFIEVRVLFFRKHYGAFSAFALKSQLYVLTAVKIIFYAILRGVTGGEHGRKVISQLAN